MINSKDNPLEWSLLLYELEDAHEHIGELIKKMLDKGVIDLESYAINMAHIYAHLNRAWNSRDFRGEMSESQWEKYRAFPVDLEPMA